MRDFSVRVRLNVRVPQGLGVRWCRRGEYVVSLGQPHGWDFSLQDYVMQKYIKTKALLATWRDVERMSAHGSARVGNFMVYSRFRYLANAQMMPAAITQAIDEDVQMLIWGKDVVFDAEEIGSDQVRRYIKKGAQYKRWAEGGIGLLHWPAHLKALAAIWMFRYNAAGEPPYKSVLDQWLARSQEGRGAVFSTIPVRELIRPLGTRRSRLPRFFVFAIRCLRELTLEPVARGFTSTDEARAEPMFTSHRIAVKRRDRGNSWRDDLMLNRVQDLLDLNAERPFTCEEIDKWLYASLETDGRYVVSYAGTDLLGNTQYDRVPFTALYADWRDFLSAASEATDYALGHTAPELASYSKIAQKLMAAMGWKPGQGLGKEEEGRSEPIPTPGPARGGRRGLRMGMARASRGGGARGSEGSDKLRLLAYETADGQMYYGKLGASTPLSGDSLEKCEVTPRGRAYPTGETILLQHDLDATAADLRTALIWDGGPVGVAEACYPHPRGWRLKGAPPDSTLERMTVRLLTKLFRSGDEAEPSCIKTWQELYPGVRIPQVLACFANPLITPRDFKCFHRIINRSIATRNVTGAPDVMCRLCGRVPERFSHIARCPRVREVFERLRALSASLVKELRRLTLSEEFVFLSWTGDAPLPGSLMAFFVILWKFVVIAFTRADLHGEKWNSDRVWQQAIRRLESRVTAHSEGVRRWTLKREGQGRLDPEGAPPDAVKRWNRTVNPCARYDERGILTWDDNVATLIAQARTNADEL